MKNLLSVLHSITEPTGLDLEYTIPPLIEGAKGKKGNRRHVLGHSRITCLTLGLPGQGLGRHSNGAELHQRVFVPAFTDDSLVQLLKPWLEDPGCPKVGHNIISADGHVLLNHGIILRGVVADTLRKSRLAYNSKLIKHALKPSMVRELGYDVVELESIDSRPKRRKPRVMGGKLQRITARKPPKSSPLHGVPGAKVIYGLGELHGISWTSTERIPHDELWRDYPQRHEAFVDYASLDAKGTAELNQVLDKRLARLPAGGGRTNVDVYRDTWHPYCELVAGMEVQGIALDVQACRDGQVVAQTDIEKYEKDLQPCADINWGAQQQLSQVLFRDWNLPRPPITGTVKAIKPAQPSQWSTAEASLHWLELNCPEYREQLGWIRKRRKARRLFGYLRDLPRFVHPDGRLHTILAPSTDTGRLASSSPPLQQIPNSKTDKYEIRRAFVAGPGKALIVADYSQLEVYVLAHFLRQIGQQKGWPGCDAIADALSTGDVYNAIAQICWPSLGGRYAGDVKLESGLTYRDLSKIVVLARNYGKTKQGLAISLLDETGKSVGEDFAGAILDAYDSGFPALACWSEYIAEFARQHGGVATLLGRWRPIPECRSSYEFERSSGNRKAANTPIQGSAADVVARAGLTLLRNPRLTALGYRQCLHVHDEIVGEVPIEAAPEALEIVRHDMEHPTGINLTVPLKVEAKIAPNWLEGK